MESHSEAQFFVEFIDKIENVLRKDSNLVARWARVNREARIAGWIRRAKVYGNPSPHLGPRHEGYINFVDLRNVVQTGAVHVCIIP